MRAHSLPAVALAFLTVFSALPTAASPVPDVSSPTPMPTSPLSATLPDGEVDGTSNAFGADGSGDWHAYDVPDYQGGILVLSGAAEPTGGVCWRPGPTPDVFFFKNTLGVARAVWDDAADPPEVAWTDVSREIYPEGHSAFLDPFLHTDEQTCRTFAGHMMLPSPCGDFAFRDEVGPDLLPTPDQWVPIPLPCQLTMQDHESLGTGPYSKDLPVPADALYPRIAYYCAQYIGTLVSVGLGPNSCAMSYDGGLTWPSVTMSSDQTKQVWQCAGLHGMIKVSPEGYAVKPHRRCMTHAGIEITKNNGLTWSAIDVPGMGQFGHFDPSIHFSSGDNGVVPSGPGAGNSVLYFGLANPASADVAVSRDFGLTWDNLDADSSPKKVSVSSFYTGPAGEKITRTEFANVVAGDWDRAAISFLGSTDTNPATDHSTCPGSPDFVWHMYVGRTFDAGRTWAVERVTDHPVQIGSIFAGGFSTGDSTCRNLLDFNDLDVDSDGRLLVSFADGCPETSCWKNGGTTQLQPTNSRGDGGVVVRQSAGRGMFAAMDNDGPGGNPGVDITQPGNGARASGTITVSGTVDRDATEPVEVTVDAGGPYSGGVASPIAILATVQDAAGPVTCSWAGADATFATPGACSTTVSFASTGSYAITVTANDGASEASDQASVQVQAAGGTLHFIGDGTRTVGTRQDQTTEVSMRLTAGADAASSWATAGYPDGDLAGYIFTPEFTFDGDVTFSGGPVSLRAWIQRPEGNALQCGVVAQLFAGDGTRLGAAGGSVPDPLPAVGTGAAEPIEMVFTFQPAAATVEGLLAHVTQQYADCGTTTTVIHWGTSTLDSRIVFAAGDVVTPPTSMSLPSFPVLHNDVGASSVAEHVEVLVGTTLAGSQDVTTDMIAQTDGFAIPVDLAGLSGAQTLTAHWYDADGTLLDSDTVNVEVAGGDQVAFTSPGDGATVTHPEQTFTGTVTHGGGGGGDDVAPTVDVVGDASGDAGTTLALTGTVTGSPAPTCQWTFAANPAGATFVGGTTSCAGVQVMAASAGTASIQLTATNAAGSDADTATATWTQPTPQLPGKELATDPTDDTVAGCDSTAQTPPNPPTPCINEPSGAHDLVRIGAANDATRAYFYATMADLGNFSAPFDINVEFQDATVPVLFYSMNVDVNAGPAIGNDAMFMTVSAGGISGGPGNPRADVRGRILGDTLEVSVDLASVGNPLPGQVLPGLRAYVSTPDSVDFHTVDSTDVVAYTMGQGTPAAADLGLEGSGLSGLSAFGPDVALDGNAEHVALYVGSTFAGSQVTDASAGADTWSIDGTLAEGANTVTAEWYDAAGELLATESIEVALDTGADLVRVMDPADGATLAEGEHAIAGGVTRSGGTSVPTVTLGSDQAGASGATLTFTATVTGTAPTCAWGFAGAPGSASFVGSTSSCAGAQVTSPTEGAATVRLTATNAAGSASDTAQATWTATPPPLQADIAEASRSGDTGTGLTFTSMVTGGAETAACTWSVDPAGPTPSATSCTGATFTSATAGSFTVTLSATAGSESDEDSAAATWADAGAHSVTITSPAAGATVTQPFTLSGGATGTSDGEWAPLAISSSPLMPSVGDLDPLVRSQAGLFWQPWMDGLEAYLAASDGFVGLVPSTWSGEPRVDAYYAGAAPLSLRFIDLPLPNGLDLRLHGHTTPHVLRQELPTDFADRRELLPAGETRHDYEPLPVDDAPWTTGIGPGSPTAQTIPGDGSYACTANYVWKDQAGKLYLGLAGHCVLSAGFDAALNSGGTFDTAGVTVDVCIADCLTGGVSQGVEDFVLGFGNYVRLGKVAYARQSFGDGGNGQLAAGDVGNDFALVEIPPALYHHVDPSMPVWDGPAGLDPMDLGTQGGRISQIHGNSVGYGETFAGKSRLGVSLEREGAPGAQLGNQVWGNGNGPGGNNGYWMALMPGEMGDSGSAVNIVDPGRAPSEDAGLGAGVLTHGIGPWNILTRLSKAVGMAASEDLCIALVPGDADPVAFPAPAPTESCGGGEDPITYDVQMSSDGSTWASVDAFDPATGAWSATVGGLPAGATTMHVRLLLDGAVMASAQRSLVLQVAAGCGGTASSLVDDDADDDGIGVAAGEILCLGARRVGDNIQLLALVEDKADVPDSGTVPTDFYYDFWFVPSWTGASAGIWTYATWDGTTLGAVTWEDQDDPLSLVPLNTPLNTAEATMRWDEANENLLILEFPLSNFESAPSDGDGFTGVAVGPNTFNEADSSVYLDCSPGNAATDCDDRDGEFTLAASGAAPVLPRLPNTRAFGPQAGSSGERVEVYVDGTFAGEDLVATTAGGSDTWTVDAILASGSRVVTAEWYDSATLLDSDTATYTVTGPANTAPTADAGPDASPAEATGHQLTGTGTDPDAGDTLTYAWSKVSGPAVTFSPSASVADPTVLLPSLDADATLVLRLTVSDGTAQDSDDVALAIDDAMVDAPTQVTGLAVTGQTESTVTFGWSASTDNVGVHHYDLVRDGAVVATPTGTTATDTGLLPGVPYAYTVHAVDAAGNAGPASSAVQVLIELDPTETWFAHQTACRAGWRMDKTDSAGDFETPCFQTEAAAGEAGDQVGAPLGPMAVYGNSVPTYGAGTGDDVAGTVFIEYDESVAGHNTVTVTLDADGTEVFRAAIVRDHAPSASTGGVAFPGYSEFDFTGDLSAGYAQGASLVWRIYHDGAARAGLGYEGDHATFLRVASTATPDFLAPGKVIGLQATASDDASVELAWTPVTDASGVSYLVQRAVGAAAFQDAGTAPTPAFTDDGLAPETTYRYRVRAVDGVGNVGPASDVVQAATLPPMPKAFVEIVAPESGATLDGPATVQGVAGLRAGGADANGDGFVIIAVPDSGINMYHDDFAGSRYVRNLDADPSNDVDFRAHPSTYLDDYPSSVPALGLTIDGNFNKNADVAAGRFAPATLNRLLWIPGTKIIGAIDISNAAAVNSAGDVVPIYDEDGHGTASASVAAGNLYGSCKECLIVFIEGLGGDTWAAAQPWIDIVSKSGGSVVNAGVVDPNGLFGLEAATRAAAESGQTLLYAAGNGCLAFACVEQTYTANGMGPDWTLDIGAAVEYNDGSTRSILQSGKPVDLSSYSLRSSGAPYKIDAACATSANGRCEHSGTSSATPITAGHLGRVLLEARHLLGDEGRSGGQRVGGASAAGYAAVAQGAPYATSPYLADGVLTRAELWHIAFHSASAMAAGPNVGPHYFVSNGGTGVGMGASPVDYTYAGYGIADNAMQARALRVLRGEEPPQLRPEADAFFAVDGDIRDALWGAWDDDLDTIPPQFVPAGPVPDLGDLGLSAREAAVDVDRLFDAFAHWSDEHGPAEGAAMPQLAHTAGAPECTGTPGASVTLRLGAASGPVVGSATLPAPDGECTTAWSIVVDFGGFGTQQTNLVAVYDDGAGGSARDSIAVNLVLDPGDGLAHHQVGTFQRLHGPVDDMAFEQDLTGRSGRQRSPDSHVVRFTVPDGTRRLALELDWPEPTADGVPVPVNDLDLYLVDADGNDIAGAAAASEAMPERFTLDLPAPGEYAAWISPYIVTGAGGEPRLPYALEVTLSAPSFAPSDPDGDGIHAVFDNCDAANADQVDGDGDGVGDLCEVGRHLQPVVLTGAQLPSLSVAVDYVEQPPQPGCGAYVPQVGASAEDCPVSGAEETQDGWSVPASAVPGQGVGSPVEHIAAYRWTGAGFEPIRVQVDERFLRYLTNYDSNFGTYSQADPELTYAFDVDGRMKEIHGEGARACADPADAGGMTAGLCDAAQPAWRDPVAGLDDDDEVVFMARDAGARAPASERPAGVLDVTELQVTDPLAPATALGYVYVGRTADPTAFEPLVSYTRDADADEFVKANRGSYGGAQGGGPCWSSDGEDVALDGAPTLLGDCDGRRARDSATVTTDAYCFHYAARWKMDIIRLRDASDGAATPDCQATDGVGDGWGADLIDRWKGRAFQMREDVGMGSSIAFEDETYWSKSSITLGERAGPVRVLRETWGADSGTHVTRLETFYANHFEQVYHLRVHPIPPDGIYAFWDHNAGAVHTYYSSMTTATAPEGLAIDGVNDEAILCSDDPDDPRGGLPTGPDDETFVVDASCPGDNGGFLVDVPDPTVQLALSNLVWDQVVGASGSMATTLEALKTAPAGVLTTYYRDDAAFDDGTGHDPSPLLQKDGCDTATATCQGSFGAHGVHFFFTADTDNAFVPAPASEFVARTGQYLLPGEEANVGEDVARIDRAALVAAPLCDDGCARGDVALRITPQQAVRTDGGTFMRPDSRGNYVFQVEAFTDEGPAAIGAWHATLVIGRNLDGTPQQSIEVQGSSTTSTTTVRVPASQIRPLQGQAQNVALLAFDLVAGAPEVVVAQAYYSETANEVAEQGQRPPVSLATPLHLAATTPVAPQDATAPGLS